MAAPNEAEQSRLRTAALTAGGVLALAPITPTVLAVAALRRRRAAGQVATKPKPVPKPKLKQKPVTVQKSVPSPTLRRAPMREDPDGDAKRAAWFAGAKQRRREAEFKQARQRAGERVVVATERRSGDRAIFARKPKGQAWESGKVAAATNTTQAFMMNTSPLITLQRLTEQVEETLTLFEKEGERRKLKQAALVGGVGASVGVAGVAGERVWHAAKHNDKVKRWAKEKLVRPAARKLTRTGFKLYKAAR